MAAETRDNKYVCLRSQTARTHAPFKGETLKRKKSDGNTVLFTVVAIAAVRQQQTGESFCFLVLYLRALRNLRDRKRDDRHGCSRSISSKLEIKL